MADTNEKTEVLSGIIDKESKTYAFQKTFHFNGQERTGSFVAKYMGIGARLRLGTIRAKLLEGAPNDSIDPMTDDLAYMIAYLSVTLVKKPSWFTYNDLDEFSDLRDLYLEVYNFTQKFRAQNEQSANAGDSQNATSTEAVESMQRTAITSE